MPDEPSLHDILRGSLAHRAEHLGDPAADITAVWTWVDRRRAHRRGIAVVGSVAVLAAGATGIMLVANPTGSPAPLDDTDGPAAMSWRCTGPLGSDGAYEYFEACDALPYVVTPTTPPVSASTIAGSIPVVSVPVIGTAPPTTALSQEQVHVVGEGDSVYGISDQFGVDPEVLSSYNGWIDGINHPLTVGERVLIPPDAVLTATTFVYAEQQHVVVPGDTLTAIAAQYGIDVVTLASYNSWAEGLDHLIKPDDVVLIPPYGTGSASATLPPMTAPMTTALISVPVSSSPVATFAPACMSTMGDVIVTVPCGTQTFASDVLTPTVVTGTGATPAGAYRCTGPLGTDDAYHYYASCEPAPAASAPATTILMSDGPIASVAATTTYPPPVPTAPEITNPPSTVAPTTPPT